MAEVSGHERPPTQFQTTYRNGLVLVWCECGKNEAIPDGRVPDDLYERHLCGPVGSTWDSAHVVPTDAVEPHRRPDE